MCSVKAFATSIPQTDQFYILYPKHFFSHSVAFLICSLPSAQYSTEHLPPRSITESLQNHTSLFVPKKQPTALGQ